MPEYIYFYIQFGLKILKQVISQTVNPNLFQLLQVAFVLPISPASFERSFFVMQSLHYNCIQFYTY